MVAIDWLSRLFEMMSVRGRLGLRCAGRSHAHVALERALDTISDEGGEPAHPDDLTTAHPRSEMVQAASSVQYCQIHDEPLHPGAGRGIRRTRNRRELPLAVLYELGGEEMMWGARKPETV